MIWRAFTSYLRNKASDVGAGEGGGSGGGAGVIADGTSTLRAEGATSAEVAPENVIELSSALVEKLGPKKAQALLASKREKVARGAKDGAKGSEVSGSQVSGSQVSGSQVSGSQVSGAESSIQNPASKIQQPAEGAAAEGAAAGDNDLKNRSTGGTANANVSAADGESVIDLSGPAGKEEEEGGEGSEEAKAPDVTGLDEAGKKYVLEVHKQNAQIRKRAQEAERERDALKVKAEELSTRMRELESVPAGGSASNNLFASFKEAKAVDVWAADALKRINLILDKSAESKLHKTPSGEEIDLGVDEAVALQEAHDIIADARAWKTQRAEHGKSAEAAKRTVGAFAKVPEYGRLHAEIAKQDPVSNWPQIVSRAAVGALVESGAYVLVKKGTTQISGKAAAASSAASQVSGAPRKTGDGSAEATGSTPREVAGTVSAGALRTDAGGGGGGLAIPSELEERARKGGQDGQEALREIIKLKTLRRRQAA